DYRQVGLQRVRDFTLVVRWDRPDAGPPDTMTFFTCPEARGPNADAPCHEVDGKSLSPAAVAHGLRRLRTHRVLYTVRSNPFADG
ncbi:MAG: hypothetical protein QOF70_6714, partial [Acetobacteraceae bacterium]|nr:hypothetical protein [Acetobacteraceae bacterium]